MIDVDRFQLSIRANTVHERVPLIEARLRDVVQGPLLDTLRTMNEHAMAASADTDEQALLFIDRLSLQLAVNTAWSDSTLAGHLAQHLVRNVARALAHAGSQPPPGLRRFENRATWLAHYLVARLDGSADRSWWFEELDGLRLLSLAGALRTVLCTQGEDSFAAVTQLSEPVLSQLLVSLGDVEPSRVVQGWLDRPSTRAVPVAQLLHVAARMQSASPAECIRGAVALERDAVGAINARSLRVLGGLSALLHANPVASHAASAAFTEDLGRWCQQAGVDTAWLAELTMDERLELGRGLCAMAPQKTVDRSLSPWRQGERPAAEKRTADFGARTPWGGVFVLASVMHWRRWPALAVQVLQSWPQARAVAPELARALQLAVATHALLGEVHAAPQATAAQHALDWASSQHDSALATAFDVTDPAALVRAHAGAARAVLRTWVQDAAECACGGPSDLQESPQEDNPLSDDGAHDNRTPLGSPLPDTTQAAQAVLSLLAARVPGCELASPAWLRTNLLASSAQLQFSEELGTLDVRLTRAPLHVLLLVAGLTSGRWPAPTGPGAATWQVNISTEDLA